MHAHERSLVKRFEGKPLAVVGVNGDTKENLRKDVDKEKMTWRSFSDGRAGGPIAVRWNVQSWPTLYVLDIKGVIRYKWLAHPGNPALDEAIDKLMAEADGAARAGGKSGP